MRHFIFVVLWSVVLSFAQWSAERVGPVSQYGKLLTGKNSAGKGRIYGSCDSISTGKEVQVKGMSLFWSTGGEGNIFYNDRAVSRLVSELNIELIRAAMGVEVDWGETDSAKGYVLKPEIQKAMVENVVESAIKNDIYVIIDWHSHSAENYTNEAKTFFREMAQKYGKYDNVIFELYNEPLNITWATIRSYAEEVISVIREHSDNLVIVGTPEWDQRTDAAINNPLNDPNVAYVHHFYAGSHCVSGTTSWGSPCEGDHALKAINAGLSVFISEWGTVNADGDGAVANRNDEWQNWMNEHKLSWANWSVSNKSEGASIFVPGTSAEGSWRYTDSGNYIKNILASNPSAYKACEDKESQSIATPRIKVKDFSLAKTASTIVLHNHQSQNVHITIFDMLGHQVYTSIHSGLEHRISLQNLSSGNYILFAKTDTYQQTMNLQIK